MQKVWSTADDEMVCPYCGGLEGTAVDLDDEFKATDGKRTNMVICPPAHPNCRCAFEVREVEQNPKINNNTNRNHKKPTSINSEGTTSNSDEKQDRNQSEKTVATVDSYAIIKPDVVISGHGSTPKQSTPNSVIDHLGVDGKTETRSFYGENGFKIKDITNHDHNNPKHHPFGEHGEHAHDYTWNEDGTLKNRTSRDLTDQEKGENNDIL